MLCDKYIFWFFNVGYGINWIFDFVFKSFGSNVRYVEIKVMIYNIWIVIELRKCFGIIIENVCLLKIKYNGM